MAWLAESVRIALGVEELDLLDLSAIERMLALQVPEGDQLDYKLKHDLRGGGPEPGSDLADDVAAFANHRGGLLVYGMKESGTLPTELVGLEPFGSPERLASRVRQAVVSYVFPPAHVDVRVVGVEVAGESREILLVSVPPSSDQPHAVRRGNALAYRVRQGHDSRYLNEHEVASRYRLRTDGATDHRRFTDELRSGLIAPLAAGTRWKHWVWCAVVPFNRGPDEFLTSAGVETTSRWLMEDQFSFPSEPRWPSGRLIARPGRLELTNAYRLTGSDKSYMEADDANAELWLNGASTFRHPYLSQFEDLEAEAAHGRMPHWWLATALLVGLAHQLRWARHCGAWGGAEVLAGLEVTPGSTIALDESPGISVDRGSFGSFVIDLSGAVGVQREVAVAAQASAIVLQASGVLAPDCLGLDGTIFTQMWRDTNHYDIERWAERHGVPHEYHPPARPRELL